MNSCVPGLDKIYSLGVALMRTAAIYGIPEKEMEGIMEDLGQLYPGPIPENMSEEILHKFSHGNEN